MGILLKILGAIIALVLVLATVVEGTFRSEAGKIYTAAPTNMSEAMATADVELGKRIYMVRNGCVDCHGEDHTGRMVMDNGAMGTIFGANITSAKLADWTDDEIARAIRYGIHKSGRSLRFMPSFDFEGLSKGDTASLIAYLRSVRGAESNNPPLSFGPIAKTLSFLNKMPVMYPAKVIDLTKGFAEKPSEGPTADFGKYLANSCVGCHGPNYTGGKIPGGDPSWPEAANIRLGANKDWTEEKFVEMIRTGVSPMSKQPLKPPMPINLLAQMNADEVKALWLYLSTLN